MNHFFTAYAGNKRSEYKLIKDHLYLKNEIKNIVEPFCGTSAMSFNIWLEHGDKFNYYLNDIDDNIIKLYNLFINESTDKILETINTRKKEITNKLEYDTLCKNKEKTIYEYYIMNKFYNIRAGLYDDKMNAKDLKLSEKQLKFIEFIKQPYVHISNQDWLILFEKLNNKNTLFMFDPPYLDACNEFYSDKRSVNVYEYFKNNSIKKQKSKICFILEKMWIVEMLFGTESHCYDKLYQAKKRKTQHAIYTNY
jgi:site-specific DNA-adenine methylase